MKLIHVSVAMSLDGHIKDRSDSQRLSTNEDLQDMYAARAKCDAILIGANTIRQDNPSLLCHSERLVADRLQRGQTAEPIKVTVTHSGNLDPKSDFFVKGDTQKIILCPVHSTMTINKQLSEAAKILMVDKINANTIVRTLEKMGVHSLFVEGGTSILTMFLSEGIFHRLRLAIAPFFIGSSAAPKLLNDAVFKNNNNNRLRIANVQNLGNMAVLDIINDGYVSNGNGNA